jgi:hypothetical protein
MENIQSLPPSRSRGSPETTKVALDSEEIRSICSEHSTVERSASEPTDPHSSLQNASTASHRNIVGSRTPFASAGGVSNDLVIPIKAAKRPSMRSKDESGPSRPSKRYSKVRQPHQRNLLPRLLPRVPPSSHPMDTAARSPSILNSEPLEIANMNTASRTIPICEGMQNHADSSLPCQVGPHTYCLQEQQPASSPTTNASSLDPRTPSSSAGTAKEEVLSSPSAGALLHKGGLSPGTKRGSPQSHTMHDDLPLHLRNKKMKATDCLLFAATLLEDVSAPSLMLAAPTSNVASTGHNRCQATHPIEDNQNPAQPRDVDVLCGRGGLINKHPGNIIYRRVVEYNKAFYSNVQKKHRILVSQSIVQSMLNFGCRFLASGTNDVTSWTEIDFKKAVQKTSQALREKPITHDGEDGTDDECVTTERGSYCNEFRIY